jgi:hypothetical protein
MYKIQSVLMPRKKYKYDEAMKWINKNGYKIGRVDVTPSLFRFRQLEPSYLKNIGYKIYKNYTLSNGVILVLVYKSLTK